MGGRCRETAIEKDREFSCGASKAAYDPDMTTTNKPKVGQRMTVRGMLCTIIKVHPFGTVDVEAPNGRNFRVTGLAFI